MHFAYPPRKSSHPPAYKPRTSGGGMPFLGMLRRGRLKTVALVGLAFVTLVFLFSRIGGGGSKGKTGPVVEYKPKGQPPVVIVTALDDKKFAKEYLATIKENRQRYADMHGYKTFFSHVGDYDLKGAPASWTSIVTMRHALSEFPDASYVWFLDQNAFIMNPKLKIEDHVMKASRLDQLMKKNHPVVPPDSIIKTFSHLKGQDVDFIVTQDKAGLSGGSFVLRNGDWAKFFLETWFDPLYRSYNFQKAETHALEHIVQWHPTILAKLAIIDQNVLNSYSNTNKGVEYKPGDLVVRFPECGPLGSAACENEARKFEQMWRQAFTET